MLKFEIESRNAEIQKYLLHLIINHFVTRPLLRYGRSERNIQNSDYLDKEI